MSKIIPAIAFAVFSLALTSPQRVAAECTVQDQSDMNTCIGDAVDSCHADAPTGCVRQLDEASDVVGRNLEACCCKGTGLKNSSKAFSTCKSDRLSRLLQAKKIFTSDYYTAIRKGIVAQKFTNCSALTCEE